MEAQKVSDVINSYRRYLDGIGKNMYPLDRHVLYQHDILRHCHWMLDKAKELVAENRIEEARELLGFIQGCLWSTSCYTLNDLENHCRPKGEESGPMATKINPQEYLREQLKRLSMDDELHDIVLKGLETLSDNEALEIANNLKRASDAIKAIEAFIE